MPLWGAVEGSRMADQDRMAQRLGNLAAEKTGLEIEQARTTLDQQKKMISIMEQQANGPPTVDDLAGAMDQMASAAAQSGMFKQAKEFVDTGSDLRKGKADIADKQAQTALREMNIYSSLLQDVYDEPSWRQANQAFRLQVGRETPYAKMPYDPVMVDKLKQGVQSAKDRASTSAAQAREEASKAEISERNARVPLIQAQTELARVRAKKLDKAGVVEPKAQDLQAITDLIVNEYGGAVATEDARVLARPIAEKMKVLMADHELTRSQAAQLAFKEAETDGVFGGLRRRPKMGGSQGRPLDIPKKKEELRPNMYYKGTGKHAGKVFLWNGTGFVTPPASGQVPDSEDTGDDDTDESDE